MTLLKYKILECLYNSSSDLCVVQIFDAVKQVESSQEKVLDALKKLNSDGFIIMPIELLVYWFIRDIKLSENTRSMFGKLAPKHTLRISNNESKNELVDLI